MKWTIATVVFAALMPTFAQSNTDQYITSVISAIDEAGLTTLGSALTFLQATPAGGTFFDQLRDGNKTVLAPSNEAFAAGGFASNLSTAGNLDTELLIDILLYHIIDETIDVNDIAVSPNHSVVETLLTGAGGGTTNSTNGSVVALNFPNDYEVPLVLTRESNDSSTFTVFNSEPPVTISSQPIQVENLLIYPFDQIIFLPRSIDQVVQSAGLGQFGLLIDTQDLLPMLNSTNTGLTIFAPDDDAFQALSAEYGEIFGDNITLFMQNHIVNGTIVFSDDIDDDLDDDDRLTPLAGPPITFMVNGTGTFVTSGDATAQVVETDYIFNGGVIHIIDTVLFNQGAQVNPQPIGSEGGSPSATSSGGGVGESGTSTPAGGQSDSPNPAWRLQTSWSLGLSGAFFSLGFMMGGTFVAI